MPQHQYMDTYVLTEAGVSMTPNHEMKRRLGFADVQPFGTAMLDALGKVASTSYGDDCGESTVPSPWARIMLTQFSNPAPGRSICARWQRFRRARWAIEPAVQVRARRRGRGGLCLVVRHYSTTGWHAAARIRDRPRAAVRFAPAPKVS